jgi:hypothetical protein
MPRGRPRALVRREERLHVLLSQTEADRLDSHVRATGGDRSEVIRRWIRETPLPLAEARPLRWVPRPCEVCGDEQHVREDIDGPYYCPTHERRRPSVVAIAKPRKAKHA